MEFPEAWVDTVRAASSWIRFILQASRSSVRRRRDLALDHGGVCEYPGSPATSSHLQSNTSIVVVEEGR